MPNTSPLKQNLTLFALGVCLLVLWYVPVLRVGLIVTALVIGLIILSYQLIYGWYVLVFLSPLLQWEFDLGFLRSSFPTLQWLWGTHAPVVEFWAVTMLIAYGIFLFRQWAVGKSVRVHCPALPWFLLFIFSALISIINLPSDERSLGFKYIGHFMLLFYFGYVVLGANIIKTAEEWRGSLKALASVGFLGAVMGATSLILGVWQGDGFHRAVPFAIYGWMPFGDQHIFLAETLTTVLPIFLYLWYRATNAVARKWWAIGAGFIAVVGLLTLSRAGWITMAFEAVVFLFLTDNRKQVREWVGRLWGLGVVVLVPMALYLELFLTSSVVARSSTAARWSLTEFALWLFQAHPIIGNGPGSFLSRAGEAYVLVQSFGVSNDALGIVQKLLSEQGLVGLVTFGCFIGFILYTIIRRYQSADYIPEARTAYFVSIFLILSPLLFQLFNTQYYSSKMWVPIALAIAQSILYYKDTTLPRLTVDLQFKAHKVFTDI